jgi:hypothetical protein
MFDQPNPRLTGFKGVRNAPIRRINGSGLVTTTNPEGDDTGIVTVGLTTAAAFMYAYLIQDYSEYSNGVPGPTLLNTYSFTKSDKLFNTLYNFKIRGYFDTALQSVEIFFDSNSIITLACTGIGPWAVNLEMRTITGSSDVMAYAEAWCKGVDQYEMYANMLGNQLVVDMVGPHTIDVYADGPAGTVYVNAFGLEITPEVV